MSDVTVITNYHRRDVLYGHDLTEAERSDIDYYAWPDERDWRERDYPALVPSPTGGSDISVGWDKEFARYKGDVIDLSDGERGYGQTDIPAWMSHWDNYRTDSYFSGIVWKYPVDTPANEYHDAVIDYEHVVIGRFYS